MTEAEIKVILFVVIVFVVVCTVFFAHYQKEHGWLDKIVEEERRIKKWEEEKAMVNELQKIKAVIEEAEKSNKQAEQKLQDIEVDYIFGVKKDDGKTTKN